MQAIGREDLIGDPVFSNQKAMIDAHRQGELYDHPGRLQAEDRREWSPS